MLSPEYRYRHRFGFHMHRRYGRCLGGSWVQSTVGTIGNPDRFRLHNAKIGKDGSWIMLDTGGCLTSPCQSTLYFWQTGTASMNACSPLCGGHWTEGSTHAINNGGPGLGQWTIRPFSTPSSTTLLISPMIPACETNGNTPPCIRSDQDSHPSWNYNPGNDSTPVFTSTFGPSTPFLGPWYNEIIAPPPSPGVIRRFAHTFNSTQSSNFSVPFAIGAVSQDGRFYLFSSDWLGTLGSSSGNSTCTLSSDCRGDVFVVELK
jgi:hypothetical protein